MQNSSLISNLIYSHNNTVPIWLMRQAGRYMNEYHEVKKKFTSFMEMCKNENALTEITLQPIKKFDFDAAIIFSDILLILDAINIDVNFVQGKGPVIKTFDNISEIQNLPKELKSDSVLPCYNAIKNLKRELQKPLIGFAAAPWTLAAYYIEGSISKDLLKIKNFAYNYSKDMDYLINLFSELITKHLIRQIKAGVDIIQIFDTHAHSMDYTMHEKYSIDQLRNITSRLKELYPNIPIIYYTKKSIDKKYDIDKYINCLSLSSNIKLSNEAKKTKKNFCYQGNLDPSLLVVGGEAMRNAATKILTEMKDEFFIFNLGHGVLPQTPTENVHELVDLVRNFNS